MHHAWTEDMKEMGHKQNTLGRLASRELLRLSQTDLLNKLCSKS